MDKEDLILFKDLYFKIRDYFIECEESDIDSKSDIPLLEYYKYAFEGIINFVEYVDLNSCNITIDFTDELKKNLDFAFCALRYAMKRVYLTLANNYIHLISRSALRYKKLDLKKYYKKYMVNRYYLVSIQKEVKRIYKDLVENNETILWNDFSFIERESDVYFDKLKCLKEIYNLINVESAESLKCRYRRGRKVDKVSKMIAGVSFLASLISLITYFVINSLKF